MKKKVLLLGGSGMLGFAICQKLLSEGDDIILFNRGIHLQNRPQEVSFVQGDRRVISDLDKLKSLNVDYIVDTMGWFPETLPYIIDIFSNRISCYIFISSVSVYADNKEDFYSELDEISSCDNPLSAFGQVSWQKRKCEAILLKTANRNFPFITLRLSHLFGYGGYNSREQLLIERLLKKETIWVPGDGKARIQYIYYKDVVELCHILINEQDKFGDKSYNVSSDRIWTITEWIENCASWLGVQADIEFEKFSVEKSRQFLYLPGNIIVNSNRIETIIGKKFRNPQKLWLREFAVA